MSDLAALAASLAAETEAYQAYVEGHRTDPDDEELFADMLKAKAAVEVAWLEYRLAAGADELAHPDSTASVDEWGHADTGPGESEAADG